MKGLSFPHRMRNSLAGIRQRRHTRSTLAKEITRKARVLLWVSFVASLSTNALAEPFTELRNEQGSIQSSVYEPGRVALHPRTDSQTRRRRADCMKVVGHTTYCECMTHRVPAVLEFADTVNLLVMSNEQLNYKQLPDNGKRIVDNTRRARDLCVEGTGETWAQPWSS